VSVPSKFESTGSCTSALILDLMHVLEKLWKAAYVFHAEGSLEAGQLADFAEQDSQGFARASPNADFFDSLGTLFAPQPSVTLVVSPSSAELRASSFFSMAIRIAA